MMTKEAVAQKVEPKVQSEPRMICQEVEDELNILETCLGAIEGIESEQNTDSSHMPVTCTFQNSLYRLQKLWREIMENPDVLNSDR